MITLKIIEKDGVMAGREDHASTWEWDLYGGKSNE
jgi:hypothetical protein